MPSPCTRCCTLDGNDVCLGCGRTIEEIMEWSIASDDRRRAILSAIEMRRQNHEPPFPTSSS